MLYLSGLEYKYETRRYSLTIIIYFLEPITFNEFSEWIKISIRSIMCKYYFRPFITWITVYLCFGLHVKRIHYTNSCSSVSFQYARFLIASWEFIIRKPFLQYKQHSSIGTVFFCWFIALSLYLSILDQGCFIKQ